MIVRNQARTSGYGISSVPGLGPAPSAKGGEREGALTPRQSIGKIRLLLAYRHTLLRQALRLLLSAAGDIEVEEAGDGREVVEKAERLKPDVVLMDMSLPVLNGLEATRLIKKRASRVKVLVLTLNPNEEDTLRLLQAGASGCLLKGSDADELSLAIRSVCRGSSYLSPAISERVIQGYMRLAEEGEGKPAERDLLTVREREILQLIAEGYSNQEIAARLVLSVKTVEAHKTNIMHKLGLRGRTELIKYAIRKGMIELEPEETEAASA